MAVGIGPGQTWEAYNAPGKPWCVAGAPSYNDDFSVNLYFSKRGRLKGVLVYDGQKEAVVGTFGKVPRSERV